MRLLQTLSRVAFICNICFLLTILIRYIPNLPEGDVTTVKGEILSTIIVMGYFLSAIVNILVNLILVMLFFFGRLRHTGIPVWLGSINFLFFAAQLYLIIIARNQP